MTTDPTTMPETLIRLLKPDDFAGAPQLVEPAPERVISGKPVQRLWIVHEDESGQFCVGKWACDGGAWRVVYTEHEYCEMLSGCIRITDEGGQVRDVRAGDRFVVAAGFRGTWEILEPASKIFAVYQAAP
jgi:uncharacterized cupin superfamily protein